MHPVKEKTPDRNLTSPSSVSDAKVPKGPSPLPKTLQTLEKLKEIEAKTP